MTEWSIDLKSRIARNSDFWVTWDERRWNDGFTLSTFNSSHRDAAHNRALLNEAIDEIAKARIQGQ